jgi:arylsulfatase A-like enzyme
VLDALPMDTAVVVQADHGGHGRNHGTDAPEDMTIPWLAAGPSIRAGHVIQTPVSLLDTAPTIAHMLGLKASPQWEGRCVDEIFVN